MTKQLIVITFIIFLSSCDETINAPQNNDIDCPPFTITNVNSGDSILNNFNVSFNTETNIVLGFSMSGNTIPVGCGTLIEFSNINGTVENLSDVVFSDASGNAINITFTSSEYENGCYLPMNTVSVYDNKVTYNSNSLLSGFQFQIVGTNVATCWDGSEVCNLSECPLYFNLEIEETAESTLFIFRDSISSLDIGDELGLYDQAGIVDSDGTIGEVLVGTGIWDGSQLEVIAIASIDLSFSGGPILPGSVSSNHVLIKIWKRYSGILLENVDATVDFGSGAFNGLFTAYSELTSQE